MATQKIISYEENFHEAVIDGKKVFLQGKLPADLTTMNVIPTGKFTKTGVEYFKVVFKISEATIIKATAEELMAL